MLNLFYNLGIYLYSKLIAFAALFNHKAKLLHAGEKDAIAYLESCIHPADRIIWVHAASLGEFEQGRPLIEQIKKDYPQYKILLTFFSPSGYELRKNYTGADYICYLPFDIKRKVKRFLAITQPQMAFFIKYEYWYNYFTITHQLGIPLYIVSGIFRESQLFFKTNFIGNWYRKVLDKVEYYFIQNKTSADLLANLGYNNFTIVGDTRFDRVAEIAAHAEKLDVIEQFKGNQQLIVVGSSWKPDEEVLASYISEASCKIVIAPHEVHEERIKEISKLSTHVARYTQCSSEELVDAKLLIIDCIGILSKIYQYADVAYIGGGFGVGIHNTLEASIYNIPIVFGPKYKKFHEACEMVDLGIAYPITNNSDIKGILDSLLNDDVEREKIRKSCQVFMTDSLGATQKIVTKVFNK